jgi:hypothetical protein
MWAGFIALACGTLAIVRVSLAEYSFPRFLFTIIVISVIAAIFIAWFKYQDYNLEKYGINTKGIVVKKKWYNGKSKGYMITYTFRYNSEIIEAKKSTNAFAEGDSLIIRFMPDCPQHHEIISRAEITRH